MAFSRKFYVSRICGPAEKKPREGDLITRVSLVTFTDWLVVGRVKVTSLGEGMPRGLRIGTRALAARNVHTKSEKVF